MCRGVRDHLHRNAPTRSWLQVGVRVAVAAMLGPPRFAVTSRGIVRVSNGSAHIVDLWTVKKEAARVRHERVRTTRPACTHGVWVRSVAVALAPLGSRACPGGAPSSPSTSCASRNAVEYVAW